MHISQRSQKGGLNIVQLKTPHEANLEISCNLCAPETPPASHSHTDVGIT